MKSNFFLSFYVYFFYAHKCFLRIEFCFSRTEDFWIFTAKSKIGANCFRKSRKYIPDGADLRFLVFARKSKPHVDNLRSDQWLISVKKNTYNYLFTSTCNKFKPWISFRCQTRFFSIMYFQEILFHYKTCVISWKLVMYSTTWFDTQTAYGKRCSLTGEPRLWK
jgi:hypothetical protein